MRNQGLYLTGCTSWSRCGATRQDEPAALAALQGSERAGGGEGLPHCAAAALDAFRTHLQPRLKRWVQLISWACALMQSMQGTLQMLGGLHTSTTHN